MYSQTCMSHVSPIFWQKYRLLEARGEGLVQTLRAIVVMLELVKVPMVVEGRDQMSQHPCIPVTQGGGLHPTYILVHSITIILNKRDVNCIINLCTACTTLVLA